MNPLVVLLVAVGVGVIAYMLGVASRRSMPVIEPRPFGLEVFERHGLGRASGDVLKAVVATITFLGHPFTVVQEAEEARASAEVRAATALDRVEENLESIRDLEADNVELENRARLADARASNLSTLVAQVNAAVAVDK